MYKDPEKILQTFNWWNKRGNYYTNYVVECSYVKEEGIVNIIKLYKELCDNNIQAQLYEHERITNVEFLENLVETYYEINEEIADRIDTESE